MFSNHSVLEYIHKTHSHFSEHSWSMWPINTETGTDFLLLGAECPAPFLVVLDSDSNSLPFTYMC